MGPVCVTIGILLPAASVHHNTQRLETPIMTPSRSPIFSLKAVMAALSLLLAVFITLPASGRNIAPPGYPGKRADPGTDVSSSG